MLFLEKETIISWAMHAIFGTLILIFAIFCSVKVVQLHSKQDKMLKETEKMLDQTEKIIKKHNQLIKKMSMKDDVFVKDNVRFYVPNYAVEKMQTKIVDKNKFYKQKKLQELDEFLPNNAVILDVGANIGNETLYWLLQSPKKARFVYSFEATDAPYNILKRNIEINGLQKKAAPLHFGLGNNDTNARIEKFKMKNFAKTKLVEDANGEYKIRKIDDLRIKQKVDVIKINMAGMEFEALDGAENLIDKDRPVVIVRMEDDNKTKVDDLMKDFAYKLAKQVGKKYYVYTPEAKVVEINNPA